jgi:hypothetical protein
MELSNFPTELSTGMSLGKNKFPLLSEQLSKSDYWYTNTNGITKYLGDVDTYGRITMKYMRLWTVFIWLRIVFSRRCM